MAETTRNPEILRELWSALGNDPQLIAECLARPLLVERLNTRIEDMKGMGEGNAVRWNGGKGQIQKKMQQRTGAATSWNCLRMSGRRRLESWLRLLEGEEQDIPLRRVSALQEDGERFYVMEVLRKGSDRVKVAVVEWKKKGFDEWWVRMGERFTPEVEGEAFTYRLPEIAAGAPLPYAPNTWSATPTGAAPTARYWHTAVWTGTEMIVCGGTRTDGSRWTLYSMRTDAVSNYKGQNMQRGLVKVQPPPLIHQYQGEGKAYGKVYIAGNSKK